MGREAVDADRLSGRGTGANATGEESSIVWRLFWGSGQRVRGVKEGLGREVGCTRTVGNKWEESLSKHRSKLTRTKATRNNKSK